MPFCRSALLFCFVTLAMFGCKDSNNQDPEPTPEPTPAPNNNPPRPNNGAGGTILSENTGSGTGAGNYRVQAIADGRDTFVGNQRFFETDLEVDVRDANGTPVSGADVRIETTLFGGVNLVEDITNNPGLYLGAMFGYDRSYILTIDGHLGNFEATAVGPAIHDIDVAAPVDISQDWVINWAPDSASFCEIDTRGQGIRFIDDLGTHTVPSDVPDYQLGEFGEERVRVLRWEILDLTGALPGSDFEVSIRVSENNVDTTDTRVGMLEGSAIDDMPGGLAAGSVYVVGWPDAFYFDGMIPWAWTQVANWPNNETYSLGPLEPGDWYFVAYFDEDLSDDGFPMPMGPTLDDPFDDWGSWVDPGQVINRDFWLNMRW